MNEKLWLNYDFHFVCPECGSSYFGSSLNKDGSLTRHCHGIGCKYEWHETKDNSLAYVSWQEITHPTKRAADGLIGWAFKCLVAQIARR